jgi:DNA-binding SARP family transcriptional activator/tetratricopeptide (TPR) repeat protein
LNVHFSLLGPLQVRRGEIPVPIRGALRRTLLAALLLNRDAVVSADLLSELLWGSEASTSTSPSLYNQVMRLRQVLGEDGELIQAVAPGYLIRLEPSRLDLAEFSDLCATARQAAARVDWLEASELYAAALALRRGEMLADIPALRAHAAVRRFEEDRLAALQGRIEADLNLGRHAELIDELSTLTTDHPLRESFHAQRMLALYRSGRQAEALDVYRALRRATVDELGVEPGPAIQALHADILDSAPSLASPAPATGPGGSRPSAPTPRQLPADTRLFAGRHAELDELIALAGDQSPGSGAVVISAVNGMGGVGKTALAVRAAHRLRERYPDGQLFIDLHGYSLNLDPVAPGAALDYLLRSLGVEPKAIPSDLDERVALYRSTLTRTRTLIVLDNAVDPDQVRPLLPAAPGCLVLITSRNRLADLDGAHLLGLDVLPRADAVVLLRGVAGTTRAAETDRYPDAAAELVAFCGHLPLAVRIVASRLRHHSALPLEALVAELREEAGRLDGLQDDERNLTSVFDSSLRVLAEQSRRLFRLLGLVPGPDFDAYAAAHLTGTDLPTAERLLEDLAEHNLLTQYTPGRYRLHDLLRVHASRLAAEDADGGAALDRLFDFYLRTARAANLLVARSTGPTAAQEPERAPEPAPDLADRDRAFAWMRGEHANLRPVLDHPAVGAPRMTALIDVLILFYNAEGPWSLAAELGSRAVAAARHAGDRPAEAEALLKLGRIAISLGNLEEASERLEQALAIYREIADRAGEATVLLDVAELAVVRNHNLQAVEPTERALAVFEEIGDRARAASALFRLGSLFFMTGRNNLAVERFRQSIAVYVEIGDLAREATALMFYGPAQYGLGDYAALRPAVERALGLYRQVGLRRGIANALQELGRQWSIVGEYAEAVPLLNEAMDIHRELGFRMGEGYVCWQLGVVRSKQGDQAEAMRLLDQAAQIFRDIESGYESMALKEIARVHHATGDSETAARVARQALSIALGNQDSEAELEARNVIAALESDRKGPAAGLAAFREALVLADRLERPDERALMLEGTGRCEIRLGLRESGLEHLGQALDLYERMGLVERGPLAAYLAEIGGGSAVDGSSAGPAPADVPSPRS